MIRSKKYGKCSKITSHTGPIPGESAFYITGLSKKKDDRYFLVVDKHMDDC